MILYNFAIFRNLLFGWHQSTRYGVVVLLCLLLSYVVHNAPPGSLALAISETRTCSNTRVEINLSSEMLPHRWPAAQLTRKALLVSKAASGAPRAVARAPHKTQAWRCCEGTLEAWSEPSETRACQVEQEAILRYNCQDKQCLVLAK